MKFKFGDKVTLRDDGFASYKGRVTGHRKRISWPFFWQKEDWYLVELLSVNGEYQGGSVVVPERDCIFDGKPKSRGHLRSIEKED